MRILIHRVIGVCALLTIGGCVTSHSTPPSSSTQPVAVDRESNEGYSLLYTLMDDESNVSKIFIIKRADDAVAGPVKEIANACEEAKKELDEYRKQEPGLRFDDPGLPAVESRSRDLEARTERSRLLTSSGKEFELRLIFTQAEATNYANCLCRALAEREQDPTRKTFLQHLAAQCGDFHQRLMKLLNVKA